MKTESDFSVLIVILIIIVGFAAGSSLDLKKWWSWLFVFVGFLLGFLMVFNTRSDQSGIFFGICSGLFFGLFVLFGGWISRKHKESTLK